MFKQAKTALFTVVGTTVLLLATPQAQAEIPWPSTFIGQPDFEFLRDEVLQGIRKSEKENADNYISVLGDLMTEGAIDPFSPQNRIQVIGTGKYSKNLKNAAQEELKTEERAFRDVYPDTKIGAEIEVVLLNDKTVKAVLSSDNEATLSASQKTIQITVNSEDVIVEYIKEVKEEKPNVQNLFAAKGKFSGLGSVTDDENNTSTLNKYRFMNTALPKIGSITSTELIDLKDFISFLENILIKTTSLVESNLKDKDFTGSLSQIQLQSIVTSPFQYVVINGQRYTVEDNFKLPVNVKMGKTQSIEKLIKPYIPKEDKISKDLYAEYIKLKEIAIGKYKERIGENKENANGDSHNVVVTIKSIAHRKVVLSIFGKDYPLEIKLLL